MKTGTIALLASCLLGQALAAPVQDKAGDIAPKLDGLTKDINIDELKDALKGLLDHAGKTGKNTGILPSKRGVSDEASTLLGNLGIDPKNLDNKTLKKVEKKLKDIADTSAAPIVRAGGLGGLLELLKPLLAGTEEQSGGVTESAQGLANAAGTLASEASKDVPAVGQASGSVGVNAPAKRADGALDGLSELLKLLGLDGVVDSVTQTADGLTSGAASNTLDVAKGTVDAALNKRQLDGVKDLVSGLLGGEKGSPLDPTKSAAGDKSPLEPLTDLLSGILGGGKGGNPLDITKPITDSVGKVADSATGSLGLNRRQLEGLDELLASLLGGGKDGSPLDITKPITDSVGKGAQSATAAAGLNRRQVEGLGELLKGPLSGAKGGNPLLGGLLGGGQGKDSSAPKDPLTSAVDGLADSLSSGVDGVSKSGGTASGSSGALGKRQLPAGIDITSLIQALNELLAPPPKAAGAAGAAGAVGGSGKRELPAGIDIAALLQALSPVLDQLEGQSLQQGPDDVADTAGAAAEAITTPAPAPIPTPSIPVPKAKRQDAAVDPLATPIPEPAPAPADITPAALPEPEGTEPLTVIFDDLSEVSSLLGEVEGAVPADQANTLRETIDSFLSSISGLLSEGPGAGAAAPGAAAPPAAAPLP
ncbi:hypothetical protein NLU13_9065 [Sarocladium strictum]|uniref:Uncharacterized protein n=1 Tax=Sarocladium strictum TaxID=5046 RepID=A0AA39G9F9_SARSR|nr:hypothetical protein NLU13_9065 [Sarocladium strictum]